MSKAQEPKGACNLVYLRFLNSPIARGERCNLFIHGDRALARLLGAGDCVRGSHFGLRWRC